MRFALLPSLASFPLPGVDVNTAIILVLFMRIAVGADPVEPVLPAAAIEAEVSAAEQSRATEIARLTQAADTSIGAQHDVAAVVAVRQLGLMRAAEAVPFLVKHINFSPAYVRNSGKRPYPITESLPCVFALGQIGHPAFDAVVKKACETDDDHTVICAAITLRVGFGADDAITLLRARKVACKTDREKSRIDQLITKIDETYRQVNFR